MSPSAQFDREASLADGMQAIRRVGVLMWRSGTVSFRVEQAMRRVALDLGADRLDAYVALTPSQPRYTAPASTTPKSPASKGSALT